MGLQPVLLRTLARGGLRVPIRTLYTQNIYPDDKYLDRMFPHQHRYRETFPDDFQPEIKDRKLALWGHRIFWTYIVFKCWTEYHQIIGHANVGKGMEDPADYTNEELGIPPLSYGHYKDWLEKKMQKSSEQKQ